MKFDRVLLCTLCIALLASASGRELLGKSKAAKAAAAAEAPEAPAQEEAPAPAPEEEMEGEVSPQQEKWSGEWKDKWEQKWKDGVEEKEKDNMEAANVVRQNVLANIDEQKAADMQFKMDLLLYAALFFGIIGVPLILYKCFCAGTFASTSAMQNVVTVERPAAAPKATIQASHARYNTEQLRQTVARLRAQV
mmetsp:Transcript_35822/g.43260  ORF Transcript_35822/g.43260 Transcript_35822/m.43260 type:complete len:193 (-) Transcript_35822:635-1213(-)|eukprot:CAMPEP_0197848182 /NCGR_PEP_ID=MMETSP1438-20131217/7969_1 /TAXON_ID=1461541 /ORGANISM="Pterosperma sp., Strain CCMP1384" /LENGTH=192 /DNA_ID=CAMNT_0043460321 /DNA_START=52 /DNA_END=630 /DNA_ORIENTATION=-